MQTRGAFFWLAVLGVLFATTPSQGTPGNEGILVVGQFLALFLAVPYLLQLRTNKMPLGLLLYPLIVASAFALSNLVMPGSGRYRLRFSGRSRCCSVSLPRTGKNCVLSSMPLWSSILPCLPFNFCPIWYWRNPPSSQAAIPVEPIAVGEFLGYLRLSGLHVEPGTYSNFCISWSSLAFF